MNYSDESCVENAAVAFRQALGALLQRDFFHCGSWCGFAERYIEEIRDAEVRQRARKLSEHVSGYCYGEIRYQLELLESNQRKRPTSRTRLMMQAHQRRRARGA